MVGRVVYLIIRVCFSLFHSLQFVQREKRPGLRFRKELDSGMNGSVLVAGFDVFGLLFSLFIVVFLSMREN